MERGRGRESRGGGRKERGRGRRGGRERGEERRKEGEEEGKEGGRERKEEEANITYSSFAMVQLGSLSVASKSNICTPVRASKRPS